MIALRLRFPAGRYHATLWGRHVNEATVAWPPEPVRILRALIACHHRKADKTLFSDDALAGLIEALAVGLPVYRLPEARYGHTRHYMPLRKDKKALVFDAFARFEPDDPLIVGWPDATLLPEQRKHLMHLASRLGYLGRAESWAEAEIIEWDGTGANAQPLDGGSHGATAYESRHTVSLHAPLSPAAYQELRNRLICEERERRRRSWTKRSKLTERALDRDMKGFVASLPNRLVDALSLDTSQLHAAGWSDPPAMRRVLYSTPELTTAWRGKRRRSFPREHPDPQVARFVLAGRPRPCIENTVQIAELMRLATLAQFGWADVDGRRRPKAPSVISGRGDDGKPLRELNHAHAFWLPEDADGDGEIDHVTVYAAAGFGRDCREKLDRVTRLWIAKHAVEDDEGHWPETGRQEWRLALEGFGSRDDFSEVSQLLGVGKVWRSVTPFLAAGHLKRGGYPAEIRRLLVKRGVVDAAAAATVEVKVLEGIEMRGRLRRSIHFRRLRSRGGEAHPDTTGAFLQLTFAEPVKGPLALGYASHFGLGLFAALR